MIQFKRGSTDSWKKLNKPLAAGQPGYDKDKHKIKVGDGESLWTKLPYASLSEEEVFDSEANAKKRLAEDPESLAIITYGTDSPSKNTTGRLYLQCVDSEPETDYIVEYGIDGIWTYQIWKSGFAHCWGTLPINTDIQNPIGNNTLFSNGTAMKSVKYPFSFSMENSIPPSETATLSSFGNKVVWLASRSSNNDASSGVYTLLSFDRCTTDTYYIVLDVKGHINKKR